MSSTNALVNGLAGAGGGIMAQIITYPLQTVNTRQQTERIAKKQQQNALLAPAAAADASSSSTMSSPTPTATSTKGGIFFQILQVIKMEGWGGLYSGLKPSLFGTAASQGIYYYFYQVFKNKAVAIAGTRKKRGLGDGTVGMFSWLVVAALAGSLNVLFTNPIWVLVTRMQLSSSSLQPLHWLLAGTAVMLIFTHTQAEKKIMEAKKEAVLREATESNSREHDDPETKLVVLDLAMRRPYGTLHAAQEVYFEAGITGFWKGIIPTLIMVCNPSIQFMIYESTLKRLKKKRATNKQILKPVTALEVFFLGAVAKFGATVATYPLLVVKSRLQAKQEIGENSAFRYTGTLDAIIKMVRYEGLPGFYKGMSTKILQSVFAASLLFMVKEELVKAILLLAEGSQKILLNVMK